MTMAVYVDNANILWRNAHWCHLLADSLEELHIFAQQLCLGRRWFHLNASYPHYDITNQMRVRALSQGALVGDRETIISCAKRLKVELLMSVQRDNGLTHHSCARIRIRQADLFHHEELIE